MNNLIDYKDLSLDELCNKFNEFDGESGYLEIVIDTTNDYKSILVNYKSNSDDDLYGYIIDGKLEFRSGYRKFNYDYRCCEESCEVSIKDVVLKLYQNMKTKLK